MPSAEKLSLMGIISDIKFYKGFSLESSHYIMVLTIGAIA